MKLKNRFPGIRGKSGFNKTFNPGAARENMLNDTPDINIAFQLFAMAEKVPDFPILTFESKGQPDEILTYGALARKGNRLAEALRSAGMVPGDSVAVVMGNRPETIISLYAGLATGAVMVPLDPGFGWEKLAYLLRRCHARGIIFSEEGADSSGDMLSALGDIKILGVKRRRGPRPSRSPRYPDLDDIFENGPGKAVVPGKAPVHDLAMILHTSGTTGIPKGVGIKTRSLHHYVVMALEVFKYTPQDRLYTGLPLTHGNSYSVTVIPSLLLGIPAVISRYFDTDRIWDICNRHGCTSFSLLGGLAADICRRPRQALDAVHSVTKVVSAGTPCHIWKVFEQRFNVTIHEWYATLEGGFAHNPPGIGPVGSFGKPEAGFFDFKVVGKEGQECMAGEIGELLFRCVDKKGGGNPGAGEWHRTGDMVHQDTQGWFFFDFRKEQGFLRHGEHFAAQEVEKVLLDHPEVGEVCVYGVDSISGAAGEQDLVAAIIPCSGITPDVIGIFEFCANRLPASARPTFLQLVKSIPRTPTEKVIRRLLKEGFEPSNPYIYQF
ncbi:MAG: AMP-binding protein [Desulfobacterium sp.]|nr:AMP-binding protein [Desulfobacterium sp.]